MARHGRGHGVGHHPQRQRQGGLPGRRGRLRRLRRAAPGEDAGDDTAGAGAGGHQWADGGDPVTTGGRTMLPNPSPDQVVDALMVLRDAALQDTLETAWATSDVQVLAGYLAILRDAKGALRALDVTLSLILEPQGADGEVVPGI